MEEHITPRSLKALLKKEAHRLGFQLFGVAPPQLPPKEAKYLGDWLKQGHAADMARYMAPNAEARSTAGALLEGAQSVIMVAMSYAQQPPDLTHQTGKPEGQIARFALGTDYHRVLKPRLIQLAKTLEENQDTAGGTPLQSRCFVDTAPILERGFARMAGLGFIGKNNCLIHPEYGSWFVLGTIVTQVFLPPDIPLENHLCGTCRKCIESCPGEALVDAFRLDARRCLAYWTTETRDPFPENLAPRLGNRLFGCDACQAVCPFNRKPLPCAEPDLCPAPAQQGEKLDGGSATLDAIMGIHSNKAFERAWQHSSLARSRLKGLRRNAQQVARNLGRPETNEIA